MSTTSTPTTLALSLRAMLAARVPHFTPPGRPQVFAVLATAERLADLERAASELELLAGAYERGFNGRIAGTDKGQLLDDFQRECDAADEMMKLLGLDPISCRTEGGAINLGRVRALMPPIERATIELSSGAGYKQVGVQFAELEDAERFRVWAIDRGAAFRREPHADILAEVRDHARAIINCGNTVSEQIRIAQPLRLLCRRLGVEL